MKIDDSSILFGSNRLEEWVTRRYKQFFNVLRHHFLNASFSQFMIEILSYSFTDRKQRLAVENNEDLEM